MTGIETLLKKNTDIIALDGDGVLFDYNEMYAQVWEKAFGKKPEKNPVRAYHVRNQYAMDFMSADHKKHFHDVFSTHGWENMMPLPGAVQACQKIHNLGFSLVIVSTMPSEHKEKRLSNAKKYDMPIAHIHTADKDIDDLGLDFYNPKKSIIEALRPVAFLDDLLINLYQLNTSTHKAWLRWDTFDNPNSPEHISWADSIHDNMTEFAQWVENHQHDLRGRNLRNVSPGYE